jgi:hypothetical protein
MIWVARDRMIGRPVTNSLTHQLTDLPVHKLRVSPERHHIHGL